MNKKYTDMIEQNRPFRDAPFKTTHRRLRDKRGGAQVRAMLIATNEKEGFVIYRVRYQDTRNIVNKTMRASIERFKQEYK